MQQQYYFLTGFPRSGNTLLSTILNQNPTIATTGHSFIPDIFLQLETIKNYNVTYKNFKTTDNLNEIQKNIFKNFFNNWKQSNIIIRSEWATPFNYSMLEKYCPNDIKIIFLMRDPIEVIKSFLNLCNKYPDFYINKTYNSIDPTTIYKSEIEEKIEIITKKNEYFDIACMSYKFIKNKKNVLVVDYNNLVKKPNDTIKKIYNFLKIPKFTHDYKIKNQFSINNISYDDSFIKAPLHIIRKGNINKMNYSIKIPNYIVNKYKNLI